MNDDYNMGYVYSRMKTLYRSQGKKLQAEECLKNEMEVYQHGKLWKEVGNALVEVLFGFYRVSLLTLAIR
ncbi:MAG: hypothetical protein QM734_06220, partial [Cyclobacteriaceae bacterium]